MKTKLGLGVLCGTALGWGCGAPSDSEIAQAVENHLRSDAALASDAIEASVTDGKVTLLGEVDSPAERDRARDLAKTVKGVRDVQNDLTVALEPAAPPAVSTPPPAEAPMETAPATAPEGATSGPPAGAPGDQPETTASSDEPGAPMGERKPSDDIAPPPTATPDPATEKAPLP